MISINAAISAWEQQPFSRGSTDCCAFADFVFKQLTGRSVLPRYNDDDSAGHILDNHGSLEAAITHYVGADPVGFDILQPGDLALVEIFDTQSVGVLTDHGSIAVVFEGKGLREINSNFCDMGWQVGR